MSTEISPQGLWERAGWTPGQFLGRAVAELAALQANGHASANVIAAIVSLMVVKPNAVSSEIAVVVAGAVGVLAGLALSGTGWA